MRAQEQYFLQQQQQFSDVPQNMMLNNSGGMMGQQLQPQMIEPQYIMTDPA